jgi:hypothetical protein
VSALAFVAAALVAAVLAAHLAANELRRFGERRLAGGTGAPGRRGRRLGQPRLDPGVERRAERRARALLRSIVNTEEWEMYRDLGFIRVVGTNADRTGGSYCYLIYPHKPIVAFLPGSNSLLSEYCVEFPDRDERTFGPRLPDSDDVIAKWMMIRANEEHLLRGANMHLPGRQVDPQQVRRDLWRLAEWERARALEGVRKGEAAVGGSQTAVSGSQTAVSGPAVGEGVAQEATA